MYRIKYSRYIWNVKKIQDLCAVILVFIITLNYLLLSEIHFLSFVRIETLNVYCSLDRVLSFGLTSLMIQWVDDFHGKPKPEVTYFKFFQSRWHVTCWLAFFFRCFCPSFVVPIHFFAQFGDHYYKTTLTFICFCKSRSLIIVISRYSQPSLFFNT